MSRLAIVIPLSGNVGLLEDTLVGVLENRPDDCRIFVVLNDTYDDPYDLHEEVTFVEAPLGAGPVTCANLGIAAASAPIVHILACGAMVTAGWTDAVLDRFDDPDVAAVAPLVLRPGEPDYVLSAGMAYQPGGAARLLGEAASPTALTRYPLAVLAPDNRAAFYRRSALELAGPFRGEVDDRLATLDMAMTLKHAGMRCVGEPGSRVYAPPAAPSPVRAFRGALEAEQTFWRWAHRAGWTRSVAWHAVTVTAECGGGFPRPAMLTRLAGRLLGCCWIGSHWRNDRHVGRLEQSAGDGKHELAGPHFQRSREFSSTEA